MANVITMPDQRASILNTFLQRYAAEREAADTNRYRERTLSQAHEQAEEQAAQDRATKWLTYFGASLKERPELLAQEAEKFLASDPKAGRYVQAFAMGRPTTDADRAAQLGDTNKVKLGTLEGSIYDRAITADSAGKPFVQDIGTLGLARPDLAGHKPYVDATAERYNFARAGDLPKEVGQAQRITSQLDPAANQKSVNATNLKMEGMRQAGENQRHAATLAAAGKAAGSSKQDIVATRAVNLAQDGIAVLNVLDKHPGFTGAVGAKGLSSGFGALDEPVPGSKEAGFLAYVERLKGLLTLPQLEVMRGLGQMSDREFQNVQASVAALNPRMPEKDFRAETKRIKETLRAIIKRGGRPAPPDDSQPPGPPGQGETTQSGGLVPDGNGGYVYR